MRGVRVLFAAALAALAVALLAPAADAARSVPRGWLGVTFGPQIAARHGSIDAEFREMARNGVESVRVAVYWFQLQPYKRNADVPRADRGAFRRSVGGHPISYRTLDALVAGAARYGLPLAPVVLGAPGWATHDRLRPIPQPRDPAEYARFVSALVHRYGAGGSFWASHPGLKQRPVQTWQVWNEVSNAWYWDDTWADSYPRLLSAAYDAIKAADPGAQVVMAGLNTGGAGQTSGTLPSWTALDRIYAGLDRQGLGRPFDATAAHIYTHTVAQAVKVVQETRDVMDAHGDARPIDVTELAWPASRGKLRDPRGHKRTFFAETNQRGMARRLSQGVAALASHRTELNIGSVDWYQWISSYVGTSDAFSYAGLRRAHHAGIENMPALTAYRRVAGRLEGRRLP
jgi:nuclear transport factor 2 (NTF2) superfamily protein